MAKKTKKNPGLLNHMNELFGSVGKKLAAGGPLDPPKREDFDTMLQFFAANMMNQNSQFIDSDNTYQSVDPDQIMNNQFNMDNPMVGFGKRDRDVMDKGKSITEMSPARAKAEASFKPDLYSAPVSKKKSNIGQYALPVISAADALIPGERFDRQKVVRPTKGFNTKLYGRGSQAIMAAGGTVEPPIYPKNAKKKPLLMSENYRDPNWAFRSNSPEATRAMDAMVVDPYTQKLMDDQALQELKAKQFFAQHPNIDINQYIAEQQQIQGSFNKDGDFIPNQNYYKPGRVIKPGLTSIDKRANEYAKFDDGGKLRKIGHNPNDGGTFQFDGPSHEQGGIDINYGGVKAEVEGQETAAFDSKGSLNIFGNMIVPGTSKKFKTVAKQIGKEEMKASKKMAKGTSLIQNSDPEDMFEKLTFNSGIAKTKGAEVQMNKLSQSKELLAALQDGMLAMAAVNGLDPKAMSEGREVKAKYGAKMRSFEGGGSVEKPSVAQRHNNPGNIKFNPKAKWMIKLGAVQGEPAKDGGYFAKFPDINAGMQAIKKNLQSNRYNNLDVLGAIKTWTNNEPYNTDLSSFGKKTIGELSDAELNNVINIITKGEDGKTYNLEQAPSAVPPTAQSIPVDPVKSKLADPVGVDDSKRTFTRNQYPFGPGAKTTPYQPAVPNSDKDMSSAADFNKLKISQIAPELVSLATNRVRPVAAQRYEPELYSPYQVSFQDSINENTANFNAIQKTLAGNPAAIGTIAAQTYAANSKVKAEEFRVNQGIESDIINKNVSLRNDAQMKNLGIADQQFVRQEQARSNTKSELFTALSSISAKNLQHDLENIQLVTNESLYDFRYKRDDKGRIIGMQHEGADPVFRFDGLPDQTTPQIGEGTQVKTVTDGSGKVKNTTYTTDNQNRQALDQQKLQLGKWNLFGNLPRQSRGRR